MKGSLVIVGFFVLGVVCGLTGIFRIDSGSFDLSYVALVGLILCVGMSIGNDLSIFGRLRSLSKLLLLLPAFTIVGTLIAVAILGIFMPGRSIPELLAVGSGFAYYSLSSVFITEYKGPELGTVALMANILRELLTLLAAPVIYRLFGPLAPISSGGATTMDTTLPAVISTTGNEFVVLSIYHGITVDFSVPLLVTFFCRI